MQKPRTLTDVLIEEIKDLASAEAQLATTLPRMAKAARDPQLRVKLAEQLEQVEEHVARLQQVADMLGAATNGRVCHAMKGHVKEALERISTASAGPARDVSLICVMQKIEHYKIAGYGCVRTYALLLRFDRVAELLQATLEDAVAVDRQFTELAERLNRAAEPANIMLRAS